MEEDLLIAKSIASGDRTAFKKLYDNYREGVGNLCYAMVREPNEAEDLVQEVFVEVFCSIGSYKGKSKLSTWIYRIAVNKSINHIRRQKVRRLFTSWAQKTASEAESNQADWALRDEEYRKHYEKALSLLSEKQKTAFVLYMYDNMPQKEIAEVMKCSLASVEVTIHRARRAIEKYIQSIDKELLR